jgi:hypothetical protein
MADELRLRGMTVERQLPVWLTYKGKVLQKRLRLDMKNQRLGPNRQQSRNRMESDL